GSSLAQVFSLILMPVISRLYSPHEMGDYALYVAISSIVGMLANFRLDLAVVLAADDDEGSRLVWIGLFSSLTIGLLSLPFLTLIREPSAFVVMTAVSIASIGSLQSLINWHSRRRRYRLLASRSASEKLIVLVLGVWLAWWGYSKFGLIVAQTIGTLYSVVYL